jgi:hypothetical protein
MATSNEVLQELALGELLPAEWRQCQAGASNSVARWQLVEGNAWEWQPRGVFLGKEGTEWSALSWQAFGPNELKQLKNFVVEVSVSGTASAAGISFGPYKDFLTVLEPGLGKRRLQLEVDAGAGTWSFRVDGRMIPRCWWDSSIHGIDDILNGTFTLKARGGDKVLFEDFQVQTFASSCRVSVIMACYRFQQRLRVSLRNWCHQDLPSGAFEILVVNPQSPDGTRELLASTARSFSNVRIREIAVGHDIAKNKGTMLNAAIRASRGEWIWLTDADCLFPPDCLSTVLDQIHGRHNRLFYAQRRYLGEGQTDGLLSGRLDGIRDFAELAGFADGRPFENAPWGYTQIVHRSVLKGLAYCEHINHFAHCDDIFVQECRRRRVLPEQVPGLFCLHLHHPFSWYGTDAFL